MKACTLRLIDYWLIDYFLFCNVLHIWIIRVLIESTDSIISLNENLNFSHVYIGNLHVRIGQDFLHVFKCLFWHNSIQSSTRKCYVFGSRTSRKSGPWTNSHYYIQTDYTYNYLNPCDSSYTLNCSPPVVAIFVELGISCLVVSQLQYMLLL